MTLTIELTDISTDQVLALAQFVKRVNYNEMRLNAENNTEAEHMFTAFSKLQDALAQAGYAPR